MSNSVNPVGIQNAPPPTPASANAASAPAPVASAQSDFKSQVPPTVQSAAPHDSDTPISPRIIVDPLAGPITEFLTASGQIQSQTPSAVVVAYLRAGLTSAGFAKPTEAETAQAENSTKNSDTGNTNNSSVVA